MGNLAVRRLVYGIMLMVLIRGLGGCTGSTNPVLDISIISLHYTFILVHLPASAPSEELMGRTEMDFGAMRIIREIETYQYQKPKF